MRKDFLIFGSPIIEDEGIEEVVSCLRSGWIGTGNKVTRFEEDFKNYKGAKYIAALNSCTAALHLSLLVAGLKPGDEVITTSMTFPATVNSIIHAGAIPVLADVDPVTMNIDPLQIEKRITPRTRAVMPVHFAGRPCEMDSIMELVDRHNLILIEDCAHAVESEYKGRKTGTFGKFGCFSFYVTKNITTGEGGMVIANYEEDIARIKMLALHGMTQDAWMRYSDKEYKHYFIMEPGYKYNMMDLQAAIGIHQLKNIDTYWKRRQEVWRYYTEAFKDLPVKLPAAPAPETKHSYHLYTILIDEAASGVSRDEFLQKMKSLNIGIGVHYLSMPEHPYYHNTFGWEPGDYPNARKIGRETVSLPLSAKLTDNDVDDVVEAVKTILK